MRPVNRGPNSQPQQVHDYSVPRIAISTPDGSLYAGLKSHDHCALRINLLKNEKMSDYIGRQAQTTTLEIRVASKASSNYTMGNTIPGLDAG